jgi:guanine deaminase
MNRWMQIAYDEATAGMLDNEGGPFGAVILRDGKLIAKAHNRVLSSNDPTAHAEVNSIREASQKLGTFNLSDCVLHTTCMPCPMCLGAIMWARISTVYYGASQSDAQRGGFDDLRFYEMLQGKEKGLTLTQIDHKESVVLFDIWNEKENRILY